MIARPIPPILRVLATLAVLGGLPAGCRSADGWREDADREVYELVQARRKRLEAGDGSFTIEPPTDSLRQRLIRGEIAELPPLTLVQCLEIASENSREYQTRKEALYLAALDLTLERWKFAVHKSGIFAGTVEGTGDRAETATGDASLGLSKLLGTGAEIVGGVGLNLTRSLTSGDSWNPVGDLGLTITQPLLRGAGSLVVREDLTQAERNLVYEVRSFERFRRTFAFDVAQRYYDLLQSQDAVRNQEVNYRNLEALSQRNAALAEAGRLSDIEAGQARQDELRSRDNLLQTQTRFEAQVDEFKVFLGLPTEIRLSFDPAELETLAAQDVTPVEMDEEHAAVHALASRLDHLNALDRREDSERKVLVSEDALRAGLKLVATWDDSSDPGKPARLNFQDSTWSLAATLDLPLERLEERNAYRRTLIEREVSRREAERSADRIRADLREDLRQTRSRLESWTIQRNAVDLATRRIESIDLKLQAGRADTRDLLEAQEALLQARNAASAALVDYTLSRVGLYRDLELLRVDEAGIHVEPLPQPGAGAEPPGQGLSKAGPGGSKESDA